MKAQLFVIELSDEARRPSKRRAGTFTMFREISSPSSAISHSRGRNCCVSTHAVYATLVLYMQPFCPKDVAIIAWHGTVNRSTVQLGEMQWLKILQ